MRKLKISFMGGKQAGCTGLISLILGIMDNSKTAFLRRRIIILLPLTKTVKIDKAYKSKHNNLEKYLNVPVSHSGFRRLN